MQSSLRTARPAEVWMWYLNLSQIILLEITNNRITLCYILQALHVSQIINKCCNLAFPHPSIIYNVKEDHIHALYKMYMYVQSYTVTNDPQVFHSVFEENFKKHLKIYPLIFTDLAGSGWWYLGAACVVKVQNAGWNINEIIQLFIWLKFASFLPHAAFRITSQHELKENN